MTVTRRLKQLNRRNQLWQNCNYFVTIKKHGEWLQCFWQTYQWIVGIMSVSKTCAWGVGLMGSMILFTTEKLLGSKAKPMPGKPSVILGRFRRAQRLQRLKKLGIAMVMALFIVTGMGSLAAYALRMQVEHDVTLLTQETRNLDELNKTLTITLNREQSFLQIAEKANQSLPRLQASAEVIDIPVDAATLSQLPKQLKKAPAPASPFPGL
jgi:hypothetical protein